MNGGNIMKNWKKNAITAAILVTVCSGIYLNWVYTGGDDTKNLEDTLDSQKVMSDDLLVLGDSSLEVGGDNTTTITDYFAAVRLSRQEARDRAVTLLQEAMAYGDASAASSTAELEQIVNTALCEAQIESLVIAKGYADCVAFLGEDSVSVVVSTETGELTAEDVTKITDIALSETGLPASAVKIMATN